MTAGAGHLCICYGPQISGGNGCIEGTAIYDDLKAECLSHGCVEIGCDFISGSIHAAVPTSTSFFAVPILSAAILLVGGVSTTSTSASY
jgi:hypothetical protein